MEFQITTRDAGRITVTCYRTRAAGIVAHRMLDASGEPIRGAWNLSHEASGLCVKSGFDHRIKALAFASRLAEACRETGFTFKAIGADGKTSAQTARQGAAAVKRAEPHGDLAHTALETSLRPIETDPMRRQIERGLDGMREANYLTRR
jgi:hypothetical protein